MASRGQCENIEIGDKQVGGWAFHTEREVKPMSEKSQDVQEGKVLGDHLAQGLFYMGWGRLREEEKKDFFLKKDHVASRNSMRFKPGHLLSVLGSLLTRQGQIS